MPVRDMSVVDGCFELFGSGTLRDADEAYPELVEYSALLRLRALSTRFVRAADCVAPYIDGESCCQ
jgi:hypothetical protein